MRNGAKTHLARKLRHDMTPAEHYLWMRLRQRQLAGCRFRRQHPIGPYIADFACLEKHLIVGRRFRASGFDHRCAAW